MSNKKPNQNKRDKKPALSSSNDTKKNNPPSKTGPSTSAAAQNPNKPAQSGKTPIQDSAKPTMASQRQTDRKTQSSNPQAASAPRLSSSSHSGGADGSGQKKSWIAPLALLFGLLGTGFSAYLYTQLKSFKEAATGQLAEQAAQSKSDIATVQTNLDQKSEEISTSLTATIDEKTTALSSSLDEKTTTLSSALDEKTSALSAELEQSSASLTENLNTTTETLKADSQESSAEIATSTASAVQELTSKTELEINNISTSFNTGIAMLRESSNEKFDKLDQQLVDLDTSVKTTNELAMRGQRDWVLAEVNYLLRTGVHRVKLAGDVKAGVLALESASDRLHTLGDINYLPVREQISEEVAALRRVGPPDIEGLIFKLQHMIKRADDLPLPPTGMEKTKQALAEDPAATTAAIGESLMNRFKGSFKIVPSEGAAESATSGLGKRKAKPTKAQLTASEGLGLHLEAARLSALRHDAGNFTDHMDNAIAHSSEIFDQTNDQVKTFISDLEGIRETNIVPKIPILGSSLALFSKVDSKRGNN